jgi:Bacterial regulatory proteins, tetR family
MIFPVQGDTDATVTTRHPHPAAGGPHQDGDRGRVRGLVLEQGYERVAVDDICDRADLARTTFYKHYPNKEAVLLSSPVGLRS